MPNFDMFKELQASIVQYDLMRINQAQSDIDGCIKTVFYQSKDNATNFGDIMEDCHEYNIV